LARCKSTQFKCSTYPSVRGAFLTPPTTAAFIGGIAAQEVIKLVTNQYRPLDNTATIDLVKSGVEKFKL
jgi:amyloid beta precursor protein binding protein 1